MTLSQLQSRSAAGVPLISLLVPSRRPHQFEGLIKSLHGTVSDFGSVEVVAKIDDDDPQAVEAYRAIARNSSISCRLVIGPRLGGVFTLWVGMEEALTQANEQAYFVMALTDEGRFLTKGWDEILRSHVGFFEDHAFRLRLSKVTALCQYANYLTCSTMPESFPIFTRRWLELTEGFTRFSYGFDAYQQAVATRLAIDDRILRDMWNSGGRFRDVPIYTIELGGIEFNKDVSEVEACTRMVMGTREWLRLVSFKEQEHISYLATKLRLYISAKARGRSNFRLRHDGRLKRVLVEDELGAIVASDSYRISRLRTYLFYFRIAVGLFPSRLSYLRQEILLSRRMRRARRDRPVAAAGRLRRAIERAGLTLSVLARQGGAALGAFVGYISLALLPVVSLALYPVARLARAVARPLVRPLSPVLRPAAGAARWLWHSCAAAAAATLRSLRNGAYRLVDACGRGWTSAKRSARRLARSGPKAVVVRARRSVRFVRQMHPIAVLMDRMLDPLDRLLWTPPPLLDRHSATNPLGTFAHLKRLAYPVVDRDVMMSEQDKIEKLKEAKYGEILY